MDLLPVQELFRNSEMSKRVIWFGACMDRDIHGHWPPLIFFKNNITIYLGTNFSNFIQ